MFTTVFFLFSHYRRFRGAAALLAVALGLLETGHPGLGVAAAVLVWLSVLSLVLQFAKWLTKIRAFVNFPKSAVAALSVYPLLSVFMTSAMAAGMT